MRLALRVGHPAERGVPTGREVYRHVGRGAGRYQTDRWEVRRTDPRRGRTLKRRGVAQERLDVRVGLAGLDAVELHEVRHAADVFDVKRLNACRDSVGHQEVELRQLDRNAGR
jgi:hypothetical protein